MSPFPNITEDLPKLPIQGIPFCALLTSAIVCPTKNVGGGVVTQGVHKQCGHLDGPPKVSGSLSNQ